MPQINLLPWREELRARRQKEFGILAGIAALLMGGVVLAVNLYFQDLIGFQQERNMYLEAQIANLDKKIKEIKTLEKEQERLLNRMRIIQELQASRPEIVHLFDELVTTLPEGVFFTRVEQKGSNLKVDGIAQSNARVSSLMRQMDGSEWLENPALGQIRAAKTKAAAAADLGVKLSEFSLSIQQSKRKKEGEEGEEEESS